MCIRTRPLFTAFLVIAVLVTARPAQAGPPLLCHPFDIGSAASLPWSGSWSWFDGQADYRLANLVGDTDALLAPSTPVIVRMETLRRAAIYASRDPDVASALLNRLAAKAQSKAAGQADALALLDGRTSPKRYPQITQIGGVTGTRIACLRFSISSAIATVAADESQHRGSPNDPGWNSRRHDRCR